MPSNRDVGTKTTAEFPLAHRLQVCPPTMCSPLDSDSTSRAATEIKRDVGPAQDGTAGVLQQGKAIRGGWKRAMPPSRFNVRPVWRIRSGSGVDDWPRNSTSRKSHAPGDRASLSGLSRRSRTLGHGKGTIGLERPFRVSQQKPGMLAVLRRARAPRLATFSLPYGPLYRTLLHCTGYVLYLIRSYAPHYG